MADGCLLLLEDGSGFLLLESSASLRLEDNSGDLELEDGSGTLLLENEVDDCLLLESCRSEGSVGGWAEPWLVRESETDLVVAVISSLRRRRRLTVG